MKNREIKFRGQRVDNNEWVYGDLIHGVGWKKGRLYILPVVENLARLPGCDHLDGFNVTPETVGQYTDLKDKNGVDIYEGDVIRLITPYRTTQTHTGDNIPNGSYTEPMEAAIKAEDGVVVFSDGAFRLELNDNILDFNITLSDHIAHWGLEEIKSAISWYKADADFFDDPEEGDLQYLMELAKVETPEALCDLFSGVEKIGNIHQNPELI